MTFTADQLDKDLVMPGLHGCLHIERSLAMRTLTAWFIPDDKTREPVKMGEVFVDEPDKLRGLMAKWCTQERLRLQTLEVGTKRKMKLGDD